MVVEIGPGEGARDEKALKLDRLLNDSCYVDDGFILGAVVGDVPGVGAKVGKKMLAAELAMGLAPMWTFGIGTIVAAQAIVYVGCFWGVEEGHGVGAKDCRG
jgi:hypothetical protein